MTEDKAEASKIISFQEVLYMPIVRVEMWEGRTVEQKRELAKAITEDMVKIAGAKPEAVVVIFEDVPKHNWATGGVLWSDR